MKHIEMIGPPGSGKSTFQSRIVQQPEFYGGVTEDGIERRLSQYTETRLLSLYRLTPGPIRSKINDIALRRMIADREFTHFLRTYPDIIAIIAELVEDTANEPEQIFRAFKRVCEEYHIGTSTATPSDKALVLDQGFAQAMVSAQWRINNHALTPSKYFHQFPVPDVLIHVDAPNEICLSRQAERGRNSVMNDWADSPKSTQQRLREICFEISDDFHNVANVIHVKNVGDVETKVTKVEEELSQVV